MQDLIKEGFFGDQYHPDMILSVNTSEHNLFQRNFGGLCTVLSVSAPFHGTHSVYTLGEKPASPPDIRFFSVGSMIAMIVHFCMFFAPLAIPGLRLPGLEQYFDTLRCEGSC